MNLSEFVDKRNATVKPSAYSVDPDWARIDAFYRIFLYFCVALGIPGNILSAIVWLRLHKKNSSAVYLAALAVNDILFLLSRLSLELLYISGLYGTWSYYCVLFLTASSSNVEPQLVLGFFIERLLAVCWPLKVRLSCLRL